MGVPELTNQTEEVVMENFAFMVFVETLECGMWRRYAQGTGYGWLAEAMVEAKMLPGVSDVRLIAWWGEPVELPRAAA